MLSPLSAEVVLAYAREWIIYDPLTGLFTWSKSGHGVHKGQTASVVNARGYVRVKLMRYPYDGHRLAWLISHGRWPSRIIDHINGDTADNRLSNLREATDAQNTTNSRMHSRNTSGYRGVSVDRKGVWYFQIQANGKRIKRSGFASREAAYAAYADRSRSLHGVFAHHKQIADHVSTGVFA